MLETRAVDVCVGGKKILEQVELSIAAGEWVTLVGPNGAGKSLLLATLAGFIAPTASDDSGVFCQGEPLGALSVRERSRKIAYVPQQPARPISMTVSDYVLLGRTPHLHPLGSEGPADKKICAAAIERLDLADLAHRHLETLSGGEMQRCHLARAIAQETPIVILDEPTTALDIGHEQKALELIDELRSERNLTVVAAMHELNAAARYSDRLVLLASGKLATSGPASEVLTRSRLRDVYGVSVRVLRRGGRDADRSDRAAGTETVVVPIRPASSHD